MITITCAYHVEVWNLSSVNRSSGGAKHRALYSRFIVHGTRDNTLKKIDQNESCQKLINSLLAPPSSPRQRRARWELCESPGRCKQSFAQWELHVWGKWQVSSNEENSKQKLFWREGTWNKDLWMIKTVVLFRGNLVPKSWTILIKKYCLLVYSPDKTSTPTVDLPASAHLKKILMDLHWGSVRFWQLSPDYHWRSTRLLSDHQPDSDNNHQCHHLSTNHNHPPILSRLNKHQ